MKRSPLKRKARLKPVSRKMSALKKQYMKQREVFLKSNPHCELLLATGNSMPATEIHHKKGRGKYLLDETTWMAVSSTAHRIIHDNPKWAKEQGYILTR